MRRARIATYLANTLDHFDTSLYGFLVPILAPLFFPKSAPITGLIKAYGMVAVGLITRPLGAWYFSKKAQKIGPNLALVITIQGMTLTTFCFVFLNSYEGCGVYGAIVLCALRGFQSFFGSGEVSIAGLYVLEGTSSEQQHQITSMYLSSQMLGILLAGSAASLIFYTQNPVLYWKWPFYGSLVTGITGWWLRKQNRATFALRPKNTPVKTDWLGMLRVAVISGFAYMLYSASFIFFNSFAELLTSAQMPEIMASNTILMVFDMVLLVILGKILRKVDCALALKTITILTIFLIPLLFLWLPKLGFSGICAARVVMITLGVAFWIPLYHWYWQEFPADQRYKTTAMGYALGSETLGRTYPAVGLAIWHYTNSPIMPGLYIALIGIFALLALGATKTKSHIT